MKYTVRMSRTFLATAKSVEADNVDEAFEKAWDYLDEGKVTFDEVINRNVSIETEDEDADI